MKWSIIYFYPDLPINIVKIAQSNPNHQVMPVKIENNREVNWLNGDRALRNELKKIFDEIKHDNILLLEYDVCINFELPTFEFEDAFAKHSYEGPEKNSEDCENWWWPEIKKIPDYLQDYAHGIFPFSIIGLKKNVLEKLLDPKWDEIFDQEIFCEVRLPTILNYIGHKPKSWPNELGTSQFILDGTESETIKEILKNNPEIKAIIHPLK